MNPAIIHFWLGANGIDLISTLEGISRLGMSGELNILVPVLGSVYAVIIFKFLIMYSIAWFGFRYWNDDKLTSFTMISMSLLIMTGGLLWQI